MHGDKRGFDTDAQPSRQKAAEKVLSDQPGESAIDRSGKGLFRFIAKYRFLVTF
jgi:hypothetical protein